MSKLDMNKVIVNQISNNPILLYMKGNPDAPECGFSAAAVKALKAVEADYAYVDVLSSPSIRERLPSISNWPTFPQLFVNGELVGGSDIVVGMAADGSLKELLASLSNTEA